MNRPNNKERKHLDDNTIQAAFDRANIEDMKNAEDIQRFSIREGYRASDSVAAAIRFGYMRGKANGNRRAQEAHTRLHEYIGVQDKDKPPADRIRNAASWINTPDVLRELAAFMEGRAATLEAGTAKVKPLEPEPDPDEEREEPDTEFDVYSNGQEEVL